jgi:hypothetical protein
MNAYTTISNILYNNNPVKTGILSRGMPLRRQLLAHLLGPIDGNPCYPSQYGAYFDVQYRIRANQSVNGCGSVSCVAHYSPTWNASWGHNDFGLSIAFMRTDHLYPHAVNHETGHVLGLKDPEMQGDCPTGGSIMHSRFNGCTVDYAYPTYNDRFNVEYISRTRGLMVRPVT